MELDFIKKTEKIQILLFDVIGDFLEKFANRVFITIVDSEENFNDFEIILLNTSNNKKINFYYSEGWLFCHPFLLWYIVKLFRWINDNKWNIYDCLEVFLAIML